MAIKTFEAKDYTEAVASSFNEATDLVVIKSILDLEKAEELACMAPDTGKQRLYLRPFHLAQMYNAVPAITSSREQVKDVLDSLFGKTVLRRAWLQIPDMIRASHVGPHVDHGGILFSTAINLRGSVNFYGRRVAESNAPMGEIKRGHEEWLSEKTFDESEILEVGDAAIIARGVLHATKASPERRAITYRSRGIVKS